MSEPCTLCPGSFLIILLSHALSSHQTALCHKNIAIAVASITPEFLDYLLPISTNIYQYLPISPDDLPFGFISPFSLQTQIKMLSMEESNGTSTQIQGEVVVVGCMLVAYLTIHYSDYPNGLVSYSFRKCSHLVCYISTSFFHL